MKEIKQGVDKGDFAQIRQRVDKGDFPYPKKENELGLTAEKDDFTEWFIQLMLKSELADYSSVSGCIVLRPASYTIWENIQKEVDLRFKKSGIKNAYFPLFIPEKTLAKEAAHVAGFSPEVAWVTHAGNTRLSEKLAVRPTSETIMYESYAKWIRSWRDLPLRLNQWNNVVRWEFKHPVPFFRTREFLWNEGHTVFATKKEAEAEKEEIIGIYKDVCENYLALPSLTGKKTNKEKFAGAEYSVSMEFYMPNGKCAQGPDFHHDGQIFAKAYNIQFLNKEGKKEYAYQNTFAISTRMLGVMFAIHSDQKGLIIPPKIASNKLVIIPILFEDSKSEVLKEAEKIKNHLMEFSPILDKREEYTPGFKFNDWELKGIPVRIEIGPKDIKEKSAVVTRRDTGKKEKVKISEINKYVEKQLDEMQFSLFSKAKNLLNNAIKQADTKEELKKVVSNKGIGFSPLCGSEKCEDWIKSETLGAKALNIPEKQPLLKNKSCIHCKKQAEYYVYIGKSY